VLIRPATAHDQPHIRALARGERIKPLGLDWPRFIVADTGAGEIVGAVQLRQHLDGSQELSSLVVAPAFRRRGIAARLIERRLMDAGDRVLVITGRAHDHYFRRFGFRRITPWAAPFIVAANYWLGHFGGGLFSKLRGRARNPLAVYERRVGG
jgi:N-acetylglutamate synthase-like GNAT family acetyltransferase